MKMCRVSWYELMVLSPLPTTLALIDTGDIVKGSKSLAELLLICDLKS